MKNVTQQTDWNDYGPCDCSAISAQPCFRWPFTGAQMEFPHTGRARIDAAAEPAPGPIWTNGTAPAAVTHAEIDLHFGGPAARGECPTWCTRHEHGGNTSEPHTLELLNLAVLDADLTTDVPLQVVIVQDLEPGSRPAVHLEIGHALYQPTGVSLSRSDRARLAAVLLTANHLTQDPA
jgi:hypothetical protein